MGDYSKALVFHEKSRGIYQKALSPNHSELADLYTCLSGVYKKMGEYSQALEFIKKPHEIHETTLPANHP
jgi:tetratricopeptide (TPR) repeat protein